MTLAQVYQSGSVRRWHAYPALAGSGQTNADHQGRCVLLLLALHPGPSVALIRAMASHDVGEMVAGDLPSDFKRAFPNVAGAHRALEDAARQKMFGEDPVLTLAEAQWLKLVDGLEAACWCLVANPFEYDRVGSGWWAQANRLLADAEALGCGDAVRGLIHDLKGERW